MTSQGGREAGRREVQPVVSFPISCAAFGGSAGESCMPAFVHCDPSGGVTEHRGRVNAAFSSTNKSLFRVLCLFGFCKEKTALRCEHCCSGGGGDGGS